MNKLFFVVPVYNVEEYLTRCISSLVSQTYKNIEIVLIDDGSKDKSGQICDEAEKNHGVITVIHRDNGGLSEARNTGIDYCLKKGDGEDWITFVDSDDFVREDFGTRMISLAEKFDAQLVQCGYEKGGGDNFTLFEKGEDFTVGKREALLGYTLKSQAWAKLYKLKMFEDIKFPSGVFNEDEFTTYKAVYKADLVAFTDERMYYYYQRETSIMDTIARKLRNNPRKNDFIAAYDERYAFFEACKEREQMLKTKEKLCNDIILRYAEQMSLKRDERDIDVVGEKYMKLYKDAYREMIRRKGIPLKRKVMFKVFLMLPISALWASKVTNLRK